MPALPVVAKVVRVDFHMEETDSPNMQNRWFFNYSGTLSPTDAITWVANLRAAYGAHMGLHMSNQVTVFKTQLTDLSSASAAQVVDDTTAAFGAGTTADIAGLSAVIQFKIARRYRGGHPRIYLPGVRTGDVINLNELAPALVSNLITDLGAFITAVTTGQPAAIGTIQQVNVSYFLGFENITLPSGRVKSVPKLRATPVTDVVTGYGINPVIGMQRRRLEQP